MKKDSQTVIAVRKELRRRKQLRWIYATEHHLNTHLQPMVFENRPYLIDIYHDVSKEIVVKKSVQCGISEWAICDIFSNAERGLNGLYVLPKYALRNRFVKRIDKVIDSVPYYRNKIGETDSLWQKRYCKSDIVFASSETPSDFVEFPADVIVIDEYDECDQDNIQRAPDRLSASYYKWIREVSTPKFEEVGIDSEFNDSDQKEWYITCEYCGESQTLDFFTNVVRETESELELLDTKWTEDSNRDIHVLCQKCSKPINRLADGEWISHEPSDRSGYHISKLFSPTNTILELWQKATKSRSNETKWRIFFNSDLGLAYTGEGDKISRQILEKCLGDYYQKTESEVETWAGIDVGSLLHIVIGTQDKVIFIGTRKEFSEVKTLFKKFNVKSAVIDIRPETRSVRRFQDKMRNIVFPCDYVKSKKTEKESWFYDRKDKLIQANRTMTIDDMVERLYEKGLQLPKGALNLADFYSQMTTPTRIVEDKGSKQVAIWTKGIDHYFHAMNYWNIACQIKSPNFLSFSG